MDQRRYQFLVAVLGTDGAQALRKAAERLEDLEHALVPRTVLAWLNIASRFDYEGEIPGVPNSHVSFTKAEIGYSGSIGIGRETFHFDKGDLYHIGAAVCVALGMEPEPIATGLRDIDLERLGKSLDTMVKARVVAEELKEAEGTGIPAIPQAPKPPAPPTSTAPAVTKPKLPRSSKGGLPKPPAPVPSSTLKLSAAEASHPCSMCGGVQIKDGKFHGCLCFRGLSKGVNTISADQLGYVLKLGADWDSEAVTTLLETVGRKPIS